MPRAYVGAEEELVQGEVDAVPPETVGRLGVKLGGRVGKGKEGKKPAKEEHGRFG